MTDLLEVRGRGWLIFIGSSMVLLGITGLIIRAVDTPETNRSKVNQSSKQSESSNSQGQSPQPSLEIAKTSIPQTISKIFLALNAGDPQSVRGLLSKTILNSSASIDAICRPFNYRAHYIESIVEKSNQSYWATCRVLYKPLDERYILLRFAIWEGRFYLAEAVSPSQDWFKVDATAAKALAKKFVYAVRARESKVVNDICVENLDVSWLLTGGPQNYSVQEGGTKVVYQDGIKFEANLTSMYPNAMTFSSWTILIEKIGTDFKVVKWTYKVYMGGTHESEDPFMERRTLKRFGIDVVS